MNNKQPNKRFNLNMPEDLWRRLQVTAERNHRTVTRQILYAIDWTTRLEKENESESFTWEYSDRNEPTEPT